MIDVPTGLFTVGVFQDVAWAQKGLDALKQAGFGAELMSILAKESDNASKLIEKVLGTGGARVESAGVGAIVGRGPLLEVLQGASGDLAKIGIAGAMRRVGFQPHDGRIFDTLVGRGGILVAIRSDPRAADALAILHSYGGGNASIGAWTGRV
jgi:hypothetical protein